MRRNGVGHALSVPDREERHLLSDDLGSGEPNPGLRPRNGGFTGIPEYDEVVNGVIKKSRLADLP